MAYNGKLLKGSQGSLHNAGYVNPKGVALERGKGQGTIMRIMGQAAE